MMVPKYFVLVSSFCLCLLGVNVSGQDPPKLPEVHVNIAGGPLVGEVIHRADNRALNRFLGVAYAQAPVDKLRFRKPLPLSHKWSTPRVSTHWPPACMQDVKQSAIKNILPTWGNQNVSEDCLYLNVWAPVIEPDPTKTPPKEGEAAPEPPAAKRLPVIVWFHGGGLAMGSTSQPEYDGETLSARGNVVVVTVNYRLSGLGFMVSTEVEDIVGNLGLWDQHQALNWVYNNIHFFGGDWTKVTIMGESAGAWSVSAHIMSPISRDYFHNAILMSGAALTEKIVTTPAALETALLTGVRKANCATNEDHVISQKIVDCLEKLPAASVDQIFYTMDKDPLDSQPLLVVDGHFIPDHPFTLLQGGHYQTNVNLLVSTVEDEGSFAFTSVAAFTNASLTLAKAKELLASHVNAHYLHQDPPQDLIDHIYFTGLKSGENPDMFRARIGEAFGDLMLGCPTLEFAKLVYQHSGDGTADAPEKAAVYQWQYRAKIGILKQPELKWTTGPAHGDDILPAFGMPFRQQAKFTNRERDISNEVMDFIAAFARTGKPGLAQAEWQAYFKTDLGEDHGGHVVVAPYYELTADYTRPANYKFNLKQLECGLIWNRFNK